MNARAYVLGRAYGRQYHGQAAPDDLVLKALREVHAPVPHPADALASFEKGRAEALAEHQAAAHT